MSPVLINAGSSGAWGWHGIQNINECPQKAAFSSLIQLKRTPKEALVKGSLLHVGLAHHYARIWAQQNGESADSFYTPEEAMARVAETEDGGFGEQFLTAVIEAYKAYRAYYLTERVKVLHVEEVFETEIGGYRYTQRLDMVYEDPQGRVWMVDHKTAGRIESKTHLGYAISGQILGMRHLGKLHFGDRFAGVKLNMICWGNGSPTFQRVDPEPAPFAQRNFETTVIAARKRFDALKAEHPDPWTWPKAFSEQTCVGRYGACEYYDACRWGPTG